jgi:tetratricopeptide (TPR) repeat protein
MAKNLTEAKEQDAEGSAEEQQADEDGEEQQEEKDLYQMEVDRYRATLKLDVDVAFGRYGFTMAHSITPEEYVRCRQEMGFKHRGAVDWYNLGCAAAKDESWSEAIRMLGKCLAEDKTFAPAMFNLAAVHEAREDFDKARKCYLKYADMILTLKSHEYFSLAGQEDREAEGEKVRAHAEKLGEQ